MSSKPVARQRIVPAIPHQLAVRRAKPPQGKNDQQLDGDKGKSAAPAPASDKAEVRKNGTGQDAHKSDDKAAIAPTTEAVSAAPKQAPAEKKDVNGVAPLPSPAPASRRQPHPQDAQARPFIPKHQPRQSETLVFGGLQDSSSASPANPSTASMPPPPVPVMPRPVAPYDNSYPVQHYAPVAPVAIMAAPPSVNGHGFAHTNGSAAHLSSMSPSPSQTSSMPPGDSHVVTPDAQAAHKLHATHPSFNMAPPDNNVQHLLDYLLAQFGQSELADYVLELSSGGHDSKPMMLPVHSLIISRCPSLLNIVSRLPASRTMPSALVLHFPQSYYFHDATAFAEALRFVYGGPLVDPTALLNPIAHSASSPDSRMRYILSYLAAGHCLDIESIAMHAYGIAQHLMSWETLEAVLSFAVPGNTLYDPRKPPFYGYYANQLLVQALDYLMLSIHPDFVLDTSAPELSSLPRLPSSHTSTSRAQSRPESRSSVFASSDGKPAQRPISGIRFGSATPAGSETSSPFLTTISSVLLSLPFELLKQILEHPRHYSALGLETMLRVAGDVVRERERRRIEVLESLEDKSSAGEAVLTREVAGRDMTGTRLNLWIGRSD